MIVRTSPTRCQSAAVTLGQKARMSDWRSHQLVERTTSNGIVGFETRMYEADLGFATSEREKIPRWTWLESMFQKLISTRA